METTVHKHQNKPSDVLLFASATEITSLFDEVRSFGAEGALLCYVGEQLPKLLRAETTYSELVRGLDLGKLYAPSEIFLNCKSAARYIDLLKHKTPNLSIMAVGDLAGLASIPIMAVLCPTGKETLSFAKFEYADPDFDLSDTIKSRAPALIDIVVRKNAGH